MEKGSKGERDRMEGQRKGGAGGAERGGQRALHHHRVARPWQDIAVSTSAEGTYTCVIRHVENLSTLLFHFKSLINHHRVPRSRHSANLTPDVHQQHTSVSGRHQYARHICRHFPFQSVTAQTK